MRVLSLAYVHHNLEWDFFLVFGSGGGGPVICIPLIVSIVSGIFDLLRLGSGSSEELFRRIQIHPIWQPAALIVFLTANEK